MIRIVTDSGADISVQEATKLGIDVVSLKIQFEDRVYTQEKDTDFQKFYEELKAARKAPKTSQPSPEDFAAVYRRAEAGDTILVVCLSGGLSGTYQSALIAKDMVETPVYVVDSRSAIMGQRLLVEKAIALRDSGVSAEGIVLALESLRERVVVWGMVDTLTYLYKGGRLPRTVAIAGNLLGIKPIVTLNEKGSIVMAGKGRSIASVVSKFEDGPAYDPEYPVYFGYTADSESSQKAQEQIVERSAIKQTGMFPVGSLIGTHVGPGCIAVAYVRKA